MMMNASGSSETAPTIFCHPAERALGPAYGWRDTGRGKGVVGWWGGVGVASSLVGRDNILCHVV
jgi:hypothetical protein